MTLNADDFDLTFQGPGTAMGNKDDAAVVINKGHMSFTDGIVVTNTGNVAVDVKSAGVIDLISDATIGAEGSKIGLRNEGTITSITGGTFYNFDNKGTVGSITGGTFDYSQAPEGVSFESIRSAVAENCLLYTSGRLCARKIFPSLIRTNSVLPPPISNNAPFFKLTLRSAP